MDNNTRNSAVVPIRAHLSAIEVVGDLEGESTSKRRDHFVIVSVDEQEIAKSDKKSRQPTPRWQWPEDHEFLFHQSSTIKIMIYRESRTRISFAKHLVGQHTGKVTELLDNNATIDLKDKAGAGISSSAKIKINLSLVPEPEDAFKNFMKTMDEDVSRLENTLAQAGTPALDVLDRALQLTKNVMDIVAGTHPFLQASWTIISTVYTAVQQTELLDDTVRALVENLRETLGIAKEKTDLLVIEGTDNVIEEIGRTSLKVAALIREYTRLRFAGRVMKYQIFDDMKSRIAQCQKSCNELKELFDRRVNMDTNLQLKLIKDDQLSNDIRQWLAAPDSSRNYNDARKKHQMGTCSWFLDGDHFREFQEKAGFLWIKGKAGSGKTILCSSIVTKIKELRNQNPSTIYYAYFFFDGRDSQDDLQQHDKLVRSLIDQFSRQCSGIPAALAELHKSEYGQPSTNSLEKVLYNIIAKMPSAYVIIDSLDECTERNETLEWIKEISHKISTLHMVVVSRPERDIKDTLQDMHCIDLAEESERDIMMYIDAQLTKREKWDAKTRNIVKSELIEKADGMFRWVELQLIELQKCSDESAVTKQLNSLPRTLFETYDRILQKGKEADPRGDAKIILRWLYFSIRPMSLAEIVEAITVDLDAENGPEYTPSRRYFEKRDVLEKCPGLIIESKGVIKFAHFSVKEYLLSSDYLYIEANTSKPLNSNWTTANSELCHSFISQTCLAYLLQFNADNSLPSSVAISKNFPLAYYAAEHWIFHAKAGGIDKSESSRMLSLATRLFAHTGAAFTNWVQIWDLDSYKQIPVSGPPLYYASLAGLQQLLLHLSKDAEINAPGGKYGNALQAASKGGYEGIAKVLLEKGADPNAQGGYYGNALLAASLRGHEGVVKVLLEKGADPNAQDEFYGNALHAASEGGHKEIVKLLLEKGADPNAQGGAYGNALQAASFRGHEGIVKVLLEKGVDPNAQGGEYVNALQAASEGGHEGIVKVLIEKGMLEKLELA